MIRRSASNGIQTNSRSDAYGDEETSDIVRNRQRQRHRQRIKKQRKNHVRGGLLLAIPLLLIVVAFVTVSLKTLIVYSKNANRRSNGNKQPLLHIHSYFPPLYPKITRTRSSQEQQKPAIDLSPEALDMCTRALWHTLETTTIVLPDGESFVHTGDLDDLWLRDSAAQVHPLLIPIFAEEGVHKQKDENTDASTLPLHTPEQPVALIASDAKLDRIVAGLIRRTALYIRHDPWANAFRIDDSYHFSQAQNGTA